MSVMLSPQLKRELTRCAREEDRSVNSVVRAALKLYFQARQKAAA